MLIDTRPSLDQQPVNRRTSVADPYAPGVDGVSIEYQSRVSIDITADVYSTRDPQFLLTAIIL